MRGLQSECEAVSVILRTLTRLVSPSRSYICTQEPDERTSMLGILTICRSLLPLHADISSVLVWWWVTILTSSRIVYWKYRQKLSSETSTLAAEATNRGNLLWSDFRRLVPALFTGTIPDSRTRARFAAGCRYAICVLNGGALRPCLQRLAYFHERPSNEHRGPIWIAQSQHRASGQR
ncbi:hypothetical protein BU23DRAFT_146013 [Bimuria novae-zelandiae CBS 107.79]|uniref:Uncharacterized protein n=1 Tax=Bimuria novae-zelandiae CBS 107.79 TaxID=1447943 RepID=A0A6A5V8C0_9PLEO|nr:hypothetical protein BU23DRAFT_146013 [Bimuria novae-zelandiae CBS 107.79]